MSTLKPARWLPMIILVLVGTLAITAASSARAFEQNPERQKAETLGPRLTPTPSAIPVCVSNAVDDEAEGLQPDFKHLAVYYPLVPIDAKERTVQFEISFYPGLGELNKDYGNYIYLFNLGKTSKEGNGLERIRLDPKTFTLELDKDGDGTFEGELYTAEYTKVNSEDKELGPTFVLDVPESYISNIYDRQIWAYSEKSGDRIADKCNMMLPPPSTTTLTPIGTVTQTVTPTETPSATSTITPTVVVPASGTLQISLSWWTSNADSASGTVYVYDSNASPVGQYSFGLTFYGYVWTGSTTISLPAGNYQAFVYTDRGTKSFHEYAWTPVQAFTINSGQSVSLNLTASGTSWPTIVPNTSTPTSTGTTTQTQTKTVTPTGTTTQTQTKTVTPTGTATQTVTPTRTLVPTAVNVPNSNFESGTSAWNTTTLTGNPDYALVSDVQHGGSYSGRIINTAYAEGGWSKSGSDLIPVIPGWGYQVGIWARTQNVSTGTGEGAYLWTQFYNSTGNPIASATASTPLTGTRDWTLTQLTLSAPSNANYLRIDLRLKGTGTAWFDDVSVPQGATLANFVTVSDGHFFLNGKPFRHFGVNAPTLLYYPGFTDGGLFDDLNNELEALKGLGIKQVRVFLPDSGHQLSNYIERINWALAAAKPRGIRLTIAFEDYYGRHNITGNYMFFPGEATWHPTPYEEGFLQADTWFDNTAIYTDFVRQIVRNYRNEDGIFAWEIGNEIKYNTPNHSQDLVNFYINTAAMIKSEDPNHLVATGLASTGYGSILPADAERLYRDPSIDYITIHHYVDNVTDTDPKNWPDMNLRSRFPQKPIVLEEFGTNIAILNVDKPRRVASFVRDVYWKAYQQPGMDAVLQWGGAITGDHGNSDDKYGPIKQGLVEEYKQVWLYLTSQLHAWNYGICTDAYLPKLTDRWQVSVWNNRDLSGSAVEQRYDFRGFPFDWGNYGASSCAGADNFSIRFTRDVNFSQPGRYTFMTYTSDGVRLWIDNALVINQWHDMPTKTFYQVDWDLTAGSHEIKMEYYENSGESYADLNWRLAPSQPTSLTGGNVLDMNGAPTSAPTNTWKVNTPVQPGEVRDAEWYWGLQGIQDVRSGAPCDLGRKHLFSPLQGAAAEYLVNFPSASQEYTFTVVGVPYNYNVQVLIDGLVVSTTPLKWNDAYNPNCNEGGPSGDNGNSHKLTLSGYQGVHAVAFRSMDTNNFTFDYFKFYMAGTTPPSPQPQPVGPPTSAAPLWFKGYTGIPNGTKISQCLPGGIQRYWVVDFAGWAIYKGTEAQWGWCGPDGSLWFQNYQPAHGVWVTWCTGTPNERYVWQTDSAYNQWDGTSYAPFLYSEGIPSGEPCSP